MSNPSTPRTVTRAQRGVVPILGFGVLTAAMDVYGGNVVQSVGPDVLAAVSFSLTAAFFVGLAAVRHGLAATFRPLRDLRRDVVGVNVTTAVTWLSMLYALKYLEPAVVSVVVVALGPILTIVLGPVLRRGSSVLRAEIWVSGGVLVVLGLLMWESVTGRSGVGELGTGQVVAGFVCTVACGVGSTSNIIFMKRLSEAGQTPQSVLAIRFFLMIGVTWVMTAFNDHPRLGAAFWPAVFVAVIGVGLPIYVLQIGIKHTEPITTSLLISVSPLITLLLQLLDGRLVPSLSSFVCTSAIIVLVALGIMRRGQKEAQEAREAWEARTPVLHGHTPPVTPEDMVKETPDDA